MSRANSPHSTPHARVVAAMLETGSIKITAQNAKLKHVEGNEYHLTFE